MRPGRISEERQFPGPHWVVDRVGLRADTVIWRRKYFSPCKEPESDSLVVEKLACNDRATAVTFIIVAITNMHCVPYGIMVSVNLEVVILPISESARGQNMPGCGICARQIFNQKIVSFHIFRICVKSIVSLL